MVGDMTEQGLGQVGGAVQQAPEEFTVDTAARKNADIVNKVRADSGKPAASQGLGVVQRQPQMQPDAQSAAIDQSAIAAIQNGQVDPRTVMNDPRVSNQAKASIQGMLR
jgi:uncharacterized protein affecting Mg2+/Co2+ transport